MRNSDTNHNEGAGGEGAETPPVVSRGCGFLRLLCLP